MIRSKCRRALFLLGLLSIGAPSSGLVPSPIAAQESAPFPADPADVETQDAIIAAVYDVISGPATDNEVGGAFIQSSLGVPTANALTAPERLVDEIWRKVFDDGDRDA